MRALFSLICVAPLALGSALAESPEPTEIVVRAARLAGPTPSSVTAVSRAEIETRQAVTALDALRGLAGVQVSQTGGPGQPSSVRVRGAASGQTLVLVDGVPANDPSALDSFGYEFLDAALIERIEVLRGAGSALWGSSAIGGVVSISTRQGRGAGFAAEVGAHETGRISAFAGGEAGRASGTLAAAAIDTDGFSAADEALGNVERDGMSAASLTARARIEAGEGVVVDGGLRAGYGRTAYDFFGGPGGDGPDVRRGRERQVDIGARWAVSDALALSARAARSETERSFSGAFASNYDGDRTLLRAEADARGFGAQALFGAEAERLESDQTFAPGGSRQRNAAFVLVRGRPMERLLVEGGLRLDDDEAYGSDVTSRAGALLEAWEGGALFVNYGEGFRAPRIDEVSGGGFAAPNPGLQPERSAEWEAGLRQVAFGDQLSVELAYFQRDVEDLIQYRPTGYVNVATAEVEGVELVVALTGESWSANVQYANTLARDGAGARLLRVARDQGSAQIAWRPAAPLELSAAAFVNGPEDDFGGDTSAWTRTDLRARYQVREGVEVFGRVENAFDESYQEEFGYGVSGRAGYVGLRFARG